MPMRPTRRCESAAHVARLQFTVSRVTANTMEPRGAWAEVGEDGRMVVHAAHQSPYNLRNGMANGNFNIKPTDIRVLTADVGGSFGMKSGVQPEYALVAWAARRLRRPVRWISDRTEGFLTDEQAREMRITVELGLDAAAQIHRAAAALGRESGRLCHRPLRLAGRQYRRHRRRLSHPDDVRGGVRHPDQHRADRRVSRRGTAGGDLHDRAHHRHRRARTRHQPVRAAPDQSDPARGDAVQDRAHLHLRLRRIRRQHAEGLGDGRARRLRGAARGGRDRAASCAASACATASRSPAVRSCVRRRIRRRCAWPRMARWCCAPARCRWGRGWRRHSASSSPIASACRSSKCATRQATPTCCPAARAMAARARCASADRRSASRWTR